MLFLDRLAERKIAEALERGELNGLPGRGKPIPPEECLHFVPEEMRTAFRLLKNAGYVPEEVRLLREAGDLLRLIDEGGEPDLRELNRLRLLLDRLGQQRGGSPALAESYFQRIAAKLSAAQA